MSPASAGDCIKKVLEINKDLSSVPGAKELALYEKAAQYRPSTRMFRHAHWIRSNFTIKCKRFHENRTNQPTVWS
jgi:hypothetical protein